MKKLLLYAGFLLACFSAKAETYYDETRRQCDIEFRIGAYAGTNFAENKPLAAIYASAQACHTMVQIDIGWSRVMPAQNVYAFKNFCFINPSLGFYYGNKIRFYGLVGITNWPALAQNHNVADLSGISLEQKIAPWKFHWNFKAGIDFYFSDCFFINVNWQYVLKTSPTPHRHEFSNNAVALGFGWRF